MPSWLDEAVEEPQKPAPGAGAEPAWLGEAVDVEAERAGRVARLADVMGSLVNPDQRAAVLEVSRKTGADPGLVEHELDFWKSRAEAAGRDPARFYDENPELAALALDQPWLGEIAVKDKPLNSLQKVLKGLRSVVNFPEIDRLEKELYGDFARSWDPAKYIPGEVPGVSPPVQKVPTEKGEAGQLRGMERLLGRWERVPSAEEYLDPNTGEVQPAGTLIYRQVTPGIYQDAAARSTASITLGQLAMRYVVKRGAGGDTYDIEKQALATRNRSVGQDYQANAVEQVFLDAAEFAGSEMLSTGVAVVGTGVGGALGGPGGAMVGNRVAAAGSFGTSFMQELGNLWEFRDQRDDQGRPVDDQVAVGAAIAYATVAAAVETGVNLGPWMKLVGPLGRSGVKVEAKALLAQLAKDPAKRVLLAKVAQQWGKTALAEGGEEGVQNLLQDLWGWYARSRSAGLAGGGTFEGQKTDVVGAIGEAVDVAGKAVAGSFVLGAAPAARHYVATRQELQRSVVAERQLAAITGAIAESPTAKASPEAFARLVEEETALSGERVTAAYVDPAGITTLAQENNVDPVELVREVAGDAGVERFREALATGSKLEIPMQEYVEHWGPSGLAEKLVADTTTRAHGVLTPRERNAERERIVEETKRLVDEIGSEQDQPTPAEQLFSGIAEQLAEAGKLPKTKVEPQVKLWRKFVRTEAARSGLEVDDVAKQLVVKVAAANTGVPGLESLTQPTAAVSVAERESGLELRFPGQPLRLKVAEEGGALRVSLLDLGVPETAENRAKHGGQGYSTALYLRALQVAKERGLAFESDVIRSDATERMYERLRGLGVPFVVAGEGLTLHRVTAEQLAAVDLDRAERLNEAEAEIKSLRAEAAATSTAPSTLAQDPKTLAKDPDRAGVGPRGWMSTVREGTRRLVTIVLAGHQDRSTFLHESGHAFWELKADLAQRADAPAQARADFEAALAWMGVKDRAELEARSREAGVIRGRAVAEKRELTAEEKAKVRELVAPFEKWARGFEAYLMEGKAPSLSLAGAFRTFRRWLLDVYRGIDSLDVDVGPEIRAVFDRMLATDDEIAAAGRAIGITGEALEQAKSRAELRALQEVSRVDEKWWQEELAREREAAGKEFDALPARRAWRFLRQQEAAGDERLAALGEVKLDHGSVVAVLGVDVAEKRFRGLLQKYSSRTGEGGLHPDHLAAILGLESGEELLQAMVSMPERSSWVDARAEEAMAAKHPDVLADRARLRQLVEQALHDEPSVVDELHRQWAEDRKKAGGKGGAPVEAIRAAAHIIVGRQLLQQLDPRRYSRAEREAFRKRATALAKGDAAAAAVLSQQRLLNFYLYREATRAKEQADAVQELAGKLASEKGQQRLGQASPVYRDMALRIMGSAGLVDGVPAEAQNAGMLDLVQAMAEQDLEPDFDTLVIEGLFRAPKRFGDLRVAELADLDNALRQIRRAARNRTTVVVNNRRVALEALVGDIRSEASKLPKKAGPAESRSQATFQQGQLWSTGQGFLASLTDPLTTYLDDDYLGPAARQAIRDRYYQARGVEHALLKDVGVKVGEAFERMPKAMRERLHDPVDRSMLAQLPDQVREGPADRGWMLLILANMGNASNLQRLLGGRGWSLDQVRELFHVNELTEEEALFIQGLWDLNDQYLWPQLVGVHERVNGTKPQKIEAAPLTLQLAGGKELTLRGGYWPAVYDPRESKLGRKQQQVTTESELNYETFRAGLLKGFTRSRSEKVEDVVRLDDFSLYPSHVFKVVRYIAYEEFVRDANRVFSAIRPTVDERLGPKAFVQLDRWLHVVASGSPDSVAAAEADLARAIGFAAHRVVSTAMIFNLKNAAADVATPLLTLFGPKGSRVRADYLTGALLEGTAGLVAPSAIGVGWSSMRELAVSKSPELQVRRDEAVRRVRHEFERIGAGGKRWRPLAKVGSSVEPGRLVDWVQHHGFILQHAVETWGTTVAWTAAYRQALAQGVSDQEAVRRADDIVQKNWSSQVSAEKSHILRSKGAAGALLIMHGFFNRVGNKVRQTAHPAMVEFGNAEGWWDKAKTLPTVATSGVMVMGIFTVVNVLGSLLEGRGPEEGEETVEWLKRKYASAPIVLLPLTSELAGMVEAAVAKDSLKGKLRFQASERSAPVVASTVRLLRAVGTVADDEKDDSKRWWAAYEVAAMGLGLPVSQPKRTVPYLLDVAAGDKDFEVNKVIYGDRPGAPANPFTIGK